MVEQRKNILLCLNISVQISSKNPLLSDSLHCIKFILSIFFNQIHLTKSTLSNPLVKFEIRKRNSLHPVMLLDKLIHLVNVLLPGSQFLYFLLLLVF